MSLADDIVAELSASQPPSNAEPQSQPSIAESIASDLFSEIQVRQPAVGVTTEGRPVFQNNQGGLSSELSIGVENPEINDGQLTHIPSIVGGKVVGQEQAEDSVVKSGGKDPITGRVITPGGDPEVRSSNIETFPIPFATGDQVEPYGFQGDTDSSLAEAPAQVPENVIAPIRKSISGFIDKLPEAFGPNKVLFGGAETALEFTTGFLASIPAGLAGLHTAIKTGDIEEATRITNEIQEAFTAEVQTKYGKDIKKVVDVPFEKYNEFVDKLVDSGDLVGGFPPEEQPAANALMSAVLKGPGLLILLGGTPKAVKTVREAGKPIKPEADPFPSDVPVEDQIVVRKEPELPETLEVVPVEKDVLPEKTPEVIEPEKTEISVSKPNKKEAPQKTLEVKPRGTPAPDSEIKKIEGEYDGEIKRIEAIKNRLEKKNEKSPDPDIQVQIEDAQETIEFLHKEKAKAVEVPKTKFETLKDTNEQQATFITEPKEVKKGEEVGDLFDVELEHTDKPPEKRAEIVDLAKDAPVITKKSHSEAQKAARAKVIRLDVENDSFISAIEKLGGGDKAEFIKQFGLDPADIAKINRSGAFGRPAFRNKGGRELDDIADALAEEGYLLRDENGKVDIREFEEKLIEELSGNKQYSSKRSFSDDAIANEYEAYAKDIESFREELQNNKVPEAHRDEMADTTKPDGVDKALLKESEIRAEAAKRPPKDSSTLYSGIPSELISTYASKAFKNLQDNLGVPEKGVSAPASSKPADGTGVLGNIRSPSNLMKSYPELTPYVRSGILAEDVANGLTDKYIRRLNAVDRALWGGAGTLKKLSPKKRKAYRENQKTLNDIMVQGDLLGKTFSKSELTELGASPEVIKAYRINRALYKKALEDINESRAASGQEPLAGIEGYVAHVFGDFFIMSGKNIIGSGKNYADAVKTGNQLKRDGVKDIKIVAKEFEFPSEAEQSISVGDIEYFKMKDQLRKDFGFTLDEANEIAVGLAKRTNRRKFFGHTMERKGVPGWEKNLNVINRHYFMKTARFVAGNHFKKIISRFEREHGKFDNEHTNPMARYKKQYINDVLGKPNYLEDFFNRTIQGARNSPVGKLMGLDLLMRQVSGSRPSHQLASLEGNVMAVTKLGLFNVSTALVNATQTLNTQALIGPKYVAKGAYKLMHDKAAGVKLLRDMGVEQQIGLEAGEGFSSVNSIGKAAKTSLFLFSKVEYFNRGIAGLGGFYKALDGKVPGIKKGDRAAAKAYGEEVIERTQFNYSLSDAPNIFRRTSGTPFSSMLRFKKFPIKEMEFITSLEGAEKPRFWVPFMAFVGYKGFPGAEAIDKMVNSVFGFSPINETDRFLVEWAGKDPEKKAFRQIVMAGLMTQAGVDISRRIGQGDILPDRASDFLGPAASTAINIHKFQSQGEWLATLKSLSPGAGNMVDAINNNGVLTSPYERNRKVTDLSLNERIAKGMGFQTMKESDASTFKRITNAQKRDEAEASKEAIDNFIKVMDSKDKKAVAEAVDALAEAGVSADSVKLEAIKKQMGRTDRAFLFALSKKQKAKNIDLYNALADD